MGLTNDIKRVLWHEMGHFCIDVLKPYHHEEYYVNQIAIQYKKRNDDLIAWFGHVEMLPTIKWHLIPQDASFMSYSLLSLVSACIFETFFFVEVLKEERKLKDCFSLNKTVLGNKDYHHYHEIISQTRQLHEYFRGHLDVNRFLEFEFIEIIKKEIDVRKDFFKALETIIDQQASTIEQEFTLKKMPSPYSFLIENEELEKLKTEVIELSEKYGFTETVLDLRNRFMEEYDSYIKKYQDPKPE